ncbi:MAG: hypothetical protein WC788_00145 [Candidatus Paceibacterota bacterium]|jgi:hypothetical protein
MEKDNNVNDRTKKNRSAFTEAIIDPLVLAIFVCYEIRLFILLFAVEFYLMYKGVDLAMINIYSLIVLLIAIRRALDNKLCEHAKRVFKYMKTEFENMRQVGASQRDEKIKKDSNVCHA